jgi:pimeloyl-ACP methyl ester carboxylesterase
MVDQRGTGRSNPLNCEMNDLNEIVQAFFGGDLQADALEACRRSLETKADLRFYTTPIAAEDIDDVRGWLGYEKINIYGGSYGTRAALVYLKQYPQRVRTIAIKAVASQSTNIILDSPRNAQRSFDQLIADCSKEAACANAFPDLRRDLEAVLDRLSKSPVTIAVKDSATGRATPVVITRNVFAGALRRALMDPDAQRGIPAAIGRALSGDFKNFENFFAPSRSIPQSLSLGLNLTVICSEDAPAITPVAIDRKTIGTFLGDGMVRGVARVCRDWPRGELPKRYYEPTRGNVPALILSGRLDPDAPPEIGTEVAKHLPNSRHIVIDGMSHLAPPACAWQLINRFVSSGSTVDLDTSCATTIRRQPFLIPR